MSDLIAYPGVQEWWKTRRHWHTEEFGRVVDAIIAKGDEPKAYSAYNLREIVARFGRHEIPLDINRNEHRTMRHGKTRSHQRLRTLEDRQ